MATTSWWTMGLLVAVVLVVRCVTIEGAPVLWKPADLEPYFIADQHFFNYIYGTSVFSFPSDIGGYGLYYGLRTRDSNKDMQTALYYSTQFNPTPVHIRPLPPKSDLAIGEQFDVEPEAARKNNSTLPNLLLTFERREKDVTEIWAKLHLSVYNVSLSAPAFTVQWTNPNISEPSYWGNGTFVDNIWPTTSDIISQFVMGGAYKIKFSTDSKALYLLVRTGFFESVKLFKYAIIQTGNTTKFEFVWKQIIIPQVDDGSGMFPQVGDIIVSGQGANETIYIFNDIDQREQEPLKAYLNGTSSWPILASAILYRIDAATGGFTGIHAIDLAATFDPFESYHLSALTAPDSEDHIYVTFNGRYVGSDEQGSVILRYRFSGSKVEVAGPVLFSVFSQDIVLACQATYQSTTIRGAYLYPLNGTMTLLLAGDAGYKQVRTGSVVVGGAGFVVHIDNPNTLFDSIASTPVRAQLFGVSGRDNAAALAQPLPTGGFLITGVIDRGLTHDAAERQGQQAILLTSDKLVSELSCEGNSTAGAWLTCMEQVCTEWCYRLPLESPINNQPLGQCVVPRIKPDNGLSAGEIIGIGVGIAVGAIIIGVVLFILFIFTRRLRQRYKRNAYEELNPARCN